MQCPRCKSRTLILSQNKRICRVPQCFYQDLHPISFDNDVRHYEGEQNGQNRFSTLYNPALEHGGIGVNSQGKTDKMLKKGLKIIKDICMLLKLNPKIQATAEARFITIERLQIKDTQSKGDKKDKKTEKQKQKQQVQNKKIKKKIQPLKQLACYAVYSACFQNDNFYQDYNLASWLGISKKQWDNMLKNIDEKIKNKIDFIPVEKPWHYIKKICRKRKIDKPEEQAMIKMCEKIAEKGIQDGCPRKTVAACVFWKICENSKKYRNQIRLTDICKRQEQFNDLSPKQAQKYFETTPETIKKFYNQKMQKTFYEEYLPDWQGRIEL